LTKQSETVCKDGTEGNGFRNNFGADKMSNEQRKNIRFLAQDNVIVALQNVYTKIGKVQDISMGGLAFEHIDDEKPNSETSRRDILLWVNGFRLSKLPGRIVYDIPLPPPNEYQGFFFHLITRRCGVEFETLSEDQASQLDFFLKTYTKGRVS
jgi:hypothetical protein